MSSGASARIVTTERGTERRIGRKAAGEVLPPSKPLTGPASPRRSVCAPGKGALNFIEQTALRKET
jgi:hypothetical protein